MYLSYLPKRKIVGGPGEIQHNLAQFSYAPKPIGKRFKSLSGKEEGVLNNIEDIYKVKTQPIPRAKIKKWREWFASCSAAETFILDSDDAASSSVNIDRLSMLLVDNSYKEAEQGIYFIVSFKVKQVY